MPHRSAVFTRLPGRAPRLGCEQAIQEDRGARLYLDIPGEQVLSVDTTPDRIMLKYDHTIVIHQVMQRINSVINLRTAW